jgi:hypothetical protein
MYGGWLTRTIRYPYAKNMKITSVARQKSKFKYRMNKHQILLSVFYFLFVTAHAQNGYIITDSSRRDNMQIINLGDLNNARYCKARENGEWVIYTPKNIKEYGLSKDIVYVSKQIQREDSGNYVFLERLQQGKVNFYYYMDTLGVTRYYFEKESGGMIEITRQNGDGLSFRKQLSAITSDCPDFSKALKLVVYNKYPLSVIIGRYNECDLKPIPVFRYGLIAGYNRVKLIRVQDDDIHYYFDLQYDGGYTLGLFADRPLLAGDFSIHPELYYTKLRMAYNSLMASKDIDLVSNISFLKMPVLIRYSLPTRIIRPFINLGGILSATIRNNTMMYQTKITGDIIEILGEKKPEPINPVSLGYVIGGGIEFRLNARHSLFLEIRHNTFIGSHGDEKISEFNYTTGINL